MKKIVLLVTMLLTQFAQADLLGYYVGQLRGEKTNKRCSVVIYKNDMMADGYAQADYVVNGHLQVADLDLRLWNESEFTLSGYQECDQRVLDLQLKDGVLVSYKYRNHSSCGFIPKLFRSSGECVNLQKQTTAVK